MITKESQVEIIDQERFDKLIHESEDFYVLDFWAPWCGPCKTMGPIFDEISTHPELTKLFKFAKINTDENRGLVEKFGVQSIPSFFLIKFTGDGDFTEDHILHDLGQSQMKFDFVKKLSKIQLELLS